MKILLKIIPGIILAFYPFLVFFSFKFFEPRIVSLLFLLLIFVHFFIVRKSKFSAIFQKYGIIILASILLVLTQIFNQILFVKIYPFLVNLFLLILFSYSLFSPPTIIEKFARIYEKNLLPPEIKYTRNVTIIWCLFFIINGLISLYTSYFSSMKIWVFYNGFLTYILIGTLFGCEYIVRYFFKKKLRNNAN